LLQSIFDGGKWTNKRMQVKCRNPKYKFQFLEVEEIHFFPSILAMFLGYYSPIFHLDVSFLELAKF